MINGNELGATRVEREDFESWPPAPPGLPPEVLEGLLSGTWRVLEVLDQSCALCVRLAPQPEAMLNARERGVLRRAAAGHSNKRVALDLGLAFSTASTLFSTALRKVGISCRTEFLRIVAALRGECRARRAPREAAPEGIVLCSIGGAERLPCTLTGAEREIASGVLRGESTASIATQRRRSTFTVANQLAAIYRKLGVGSRWELALLTKTGFIAGLMALCAFGAGCSAGAGDLSDDCQQAQQDWGQKTQSLGQSCYAGSYERHLSTRGQLQRLL